MTFSSPVTDRSKRVLRPDHIRGILGAMRAWKALTPEQRENLVTSLERDDLSDEGQAGAAVLRAISVTMKVKR